MKRFLREIIFICFVLVWFSICLFSWAGQIVVGSAAPSLKVLSGDNEQLTLEDLKGKVAIVFYETKETAEINRRLKDELNRFYKEQPPPIKQLIVRLAVINCSGVLFKGVWKKALRENSRKEGIVIYGDWDGKMFSHYNMKDKESNVLIIDKNGIIRFFAAGKVEDKEIPTVKELIRNLFNR